MNPDSENVYIFDDFQLEKDEAALYHRGLLIEDGGKKMLQVLAAYLHHPNVIVRHDDVLNAVWGNEAFGVTSDTVNQYINQIRRVLAKYEPDREYFKNI